MAAPTSPDATRKRTRRAINQLNQLGWTVTLNPKENAA